MPLHKWRLCGNGTWFDSSGMKLCRGAAFFPTGGARLGENLHAQTWHVGRHTLTSKVYGSERKRHSGFECLDSAGDAVTRSVVSFGFSVLWDTGQPTVHRQQVFVLRLQVIQSWMRISGCKPSSHILFVQLSPRLSCFFTLQLSV